jgi:hypothetical protein
MPARTAMVEPQPVILTATDGNCHQRTVVSFSDAGSGKHPAVTFFHGCSRREMLLGWHNMFYYHRLTASLLS